MNKGKNLFKNAFQPKADFVTYNDKYVSGFSCYFNIYKNYFCQSLDVYEASKVRQTETEPLMPETSAFK